MVLMKILVGKYETKAGEKVKFGNTVDMPEEEAERAILCNVAEYSETKPIKVQGTETTGQEQPELKTKARK